ncbi:MAG: putative hydrolase of HD superfamily [Sulfitobacter sp.]|jgi:5'-deoxynucleotidase YfbR-like HD superfamily hydrolase
MSDPALSRLERQVAFLNEADKLKTTIRATELCDNSRYENSAEHSWHLTLYALVLADQAGPDVDLNLVIKMLILHDLVEIDAGDNPIFGDYDAAEMEAQEQSAANRIFGLLPDDLRDGLRAIWEEFEAAQTPSAQFAKSLDRFQPPMQNLQSGGGSWVDFNVTQAQIAARVGSKIAIGAPRLWDFAKVRIADFFADYENRKKP